MCIYMCKLCTLHIDDLPVWKSKQEKVSLFFSFSFFDNDDVTDNAMDGGFNIKSSSFVAGDWSMSV